jgi:hypothetical protein
LQSLELFDCFRQIALDDFKVHAFSVSRARCLQ